MWGSFIPYSMPVYPGAFGPTPDQLKKLRTSTKEALKNEAEKLIAHMQEITRDCNELITALVGPPVEVVKKSKLRKAKK
jgi:hypothetical protein